MAEVCSAGCFTLRLGTVAESLSRRHVPDFFPTPGVRMPLSMTFPSAWRSVQLGTTNWSMSTLLANRPTSAGQRGLPGGSAAEVAAIGPPPVHVRRDRPPARAVPRYRTTSAACVDPATRPGRCQSIAARPGYGRPGDSPSGLHEPLQSGPVGIDIVGRTRVPHRAGHLGSRAVGTGAATLAALPNRRPQPLCTSSRAQCALRQEELHCPKQLQEGPRDNAVLQTGKGAAQKVLAAQAPVSTDLSCG